MAKKALVTGASGFVGSALVEHLAKDGFEVLALMRRSSNPRNLAGMDYKKVEGSLSDLESLKRAVEGVDYVFHVAGVVSGTPAEFFEANTEGTKRLAQAVAERNPGLKRFVLVSSLAAGGPALNQNPRTEKDLDAPVSAYGKSKFEGERELQKFHDRFPVVVVRPPIVYGPKDRGILTVVKTVARGLMPLPPSKVEGGHKYYSSVHVQDLVKGITQAALSPVDQVPSGEVFYISGDGVDTYEDLMIAMAKGLGKRTIKFRVPRVALTAAAAGFTALGKMMGKAFPLNSDKLNEILPDYWICTNAKAKSMLGFAPTYDLTQGMAETVQWYKNAGWL